MKSKEEIEAEYKGLPINTCINPNCKCHKMTYQEKAIRLAIEKGNYKESEKTFLDPLVWQALGRALGWDEKIDEIVGTKLKFHPPQFTWLYYWHCFIDRLAEGKDPEEFWKELIG